MRRVVVTGMGIVSSIGNNCQEVLDALKTQKSGIVFNQEQADFGFRSHVSGSVDANLQELVPRKLLRFMGDASAYNYTISSACATSGHCLGNAYQLIQAGEQDLMFVGAGDEVTWIISIAFDAMGALSSNYNDRPDRASRTYDKDRDGFVVSGGGGTIVLEEYERARARGARIYCELTGYGVSSDGADMVRPSGEGAERCMEMALRKVEGSIDYLNTHGTSTPAGDITELEAIRNVFDSQIPAISSTKSLTGHALGAASVNEAIYSILMMEHDFICPSVNVENLDPDAEGYPIVLELREDVQLQNIMSNSFGFGGTNCSLVFSKT